jgi:hydroxyacylglutathione hydrolase
MLKLRDGSGAAHSYGGVPADTAVFCAHEYSQSNARFAAQVAEPANAALKERKGRIDEARARGHGTVPFWWGEELEANPFLRADKGGVRAAAGVAAAREAGGDEAADAVETFRRVRAAKDSFR